MLEVHNEPLFDIAKQLAEVQDKIKVLEEEVTEPRVRRSNI